MILFFKMTTSDLYGSRLVLSPIVTRPAAQQQHSVCLGWWGGYGFLPIIKSRTTHVEVELGCDNLSSPQPGVGLYSYSTKTQQMNVCVFVPKLKSQMYSYSHSSLNSIFVTHLREYLSSSTVGFFLTDKSSQRVMYHCL